MIKQTINTANPFFLIFVVIVCAFLYMMTAACANHEITGGARQDWLSMTIKFKPGTTSEIRDSAIGIIEKGIADTVGILRKQYPRYNPPISVSKFLFGDTLVYSLTVGARNIHLPYTSDSSTTIPVPRCLCATQCSLVCANRYLMGQQPVTKGEISSKRTLDDIIEDIKEN